MSEEKKDGRKPDWAAVQIGDPQVFAKLTPDGRLACIKVAVTLREQVGELYEVKGKVSVTSQGYYALNRYAGISLVGPKMLQTPEGERPNPWIELDPATGYLRAVWVRRVAFGLGPAASLAIVDRTLHFEPKAYLLQDLTKKAMDQPAVGKILVRERVGEHEAEAKVKGWFLPIEGPVGLWVNLGHPEVIQAFETHTQRLRFAERHATSICERNALRAHPAIAKTQVEAQGNKPNRWTVVTVFGFRHDLDRKQVERLAVLVADDHGDKLQEEAKALGLGEPQREAAQEKAGEEDLGAAVPENGEGAPAEAEARADASPAPAPPQPTGETGDSRDAALADVRLGRKALGDEKAFRELMAKAGITAPLGEATAGQLKALGKLISSEVDRRLAGRK